MLDVGSEIVVITYGQQVTINLKPLVITKDNKDGIHGRIPGKVGSDNEGCLECALKDAFEYLSKSDKIRNKVVIFTASHNENQVEVKRYLKKLSSRSEVNLVIAGEHACNLCRGRNANLNSWVMIQWMTICQQLHWLNGIMQ